MVTKAGSKSATSKKENGKNNEKKNAWLKYNAADRKKLDELCEGYIDFISDCKTERECTEEIVKEARAHGYNRKEA